MQDREVDRQDRDQEEQRARGAHAGDLILDRGAGQRCPDGHDRHRAQRAQHPEHRRAQQRLRDREEERPGEEDEALDDADDAEEREHGRRRGPLVAEQREDEVAGRGHHREGRDRGEQGQAEALLDAVAQPLRIRLEPREVRQRDHPDRAHRELQD
jgi:hypothetical protein